jgi:hypothetical protein
MEPKVLVPEKYGRALVAPVYREEVATARLAVPPTPVIEPENPFVAPTPVRVVVPTLCTAPVPDPYSSCPEESVVSPVPPFPTFSVPARVTAPVVAVLGVRPVEPAEKVVTPLLIVEVATQVGTPALNART